jgi:hypothetical protein
MDERLVVYHPDTGLFSPDRRPHAIGCNIWALHPCSCGSIQPVKWQPGWTAPLIWFLMILMVLGALMTPAVIVCSTWSLFSGHPVCGI